MIPAPEFARRIALDTIGETPRRIEIAADAGERAALATRFALEALGRLEAWVELRRQGAIVHAEGELSAALTQACVVTGDPVPTTLDLPFALRFVSKDMLAAEDEVELSAEDCDTVPYDGAGIDIGEAVAETLALALDPFPRAAGADAALRAAGVVSEEEAAVKRSPFGVLRGLG